MKEKDNNIDEALKYGVASNAIEGLHTSDKAREAIKKALENGTSDKSFLYNLMNIIKEVKEQEIEDDKHVKTRK